jgi:hypothetical protein
MFEGAAPHWKIWHFSRAPKRVAAKYSVLIQRAPSEADEAAFAFERQMRIAEIDDAVQQLQNSRLIRHARRYRLVLPPLDEKHEGWEESEFTQQWRLTPEAFIVLRNAVRAERKARQEMWQIRIVGISAATGLIGALTGTTVERMYSSLSASLNAPASGR